MNWIEEIIHDISSISSTKRDLRKFGFTIGGVLLAIDAFALWKGWWSDAIILWCAIFGFAVLVAGLLFPKSLFYFNKIWMSLAIVLGSIVSQFILSILFFLIVTPVAFIAKIFGKKFFLSYKENTSITYWISREKNKKINYEQMF